MILGKTDKQLVQETFLEEVMFKLRSEGWGIANNLVKM